MLKKYEHKIKRKNQEKIEMKMKKLKIDTL